MAAATGSPFFTVFTPTYNRAHTLHRVFDSLCAQTFRDFEWLIVDDGSTDNTSALIDSWTGVANFPIRFFRQPHSGNHIAHNLALREGRGEMLTSIDSDDELVPHALERVRDLWLEIPEAQRGNFYSVAGLCRDQHGRQISREFPTSPFDVDVREYMFLHRRFAGEKWGAAPMAAMRKFPFPEIKGTNFIPEGVQGMQMGRVYKTIRFVNEIFRIYYVNDSDTGATLSSRREVARNAPGRIYYYLWLLNHEMDYFWSAPAPFIKAAAMLPVVAHYARRPLGNVWQELESWRARILVIAALPLSVLLGVCCKLTGQRQ